MSTSWPEMVELSDQQRLVQRNIREICDDFDAEYWREKEQSAEYPHEFVDTLIEHGWLGIHVPEELGGVGMGISEAVVMLEEIASSPGGGTAVSAVQGAIYALRPVVEYGSEQQKSELVPKFMNGEELLLSMAVTEPNAGSDTLSIETSAERDGDIYRINGQKIWTSRANITDYILLIARTTPKEEVEKRTRGLSMFLIDKERALESGGLTMESIPKAVALANPAFELWFDDLEVPADALVGAEDEGFYQLLDGLNGERVVVAAGTLGVGQIALQRAVEYANEREIFDRPIGKNQAIQHPLAKAYVHLQGAKSVIYRTAKKVDAEGGDKREIGAYANTAKYLAAEAAFEAADAAVQTHGGFGVAKEYDVERYFMETRLQRLAPVAQELVLNHISEKVLGLPRSY